MEKGAICFSLLLKLRHISRQCRGFSTSQLARTIYESDNYLINYDFPKLTPEQVTSVLRLREFYARDLGGSVGLVESTKLPSNSPCEDKRAICRSTHDGSLLFGVFDGHAGGACAEAIRQRLFEYLAVGLLPPSERDNIYQHSVVGGEALHLVDYIFPPDPTQRPEPTARHRVGLERLLAAEEDDVMGEEEDVFVSAFTRLDRDFSREALPPEPHLPRDSEALEIALSGACACLAHVAEQQVTIAHVGDCRAVLGYHGGDGEWIARSLCDLHNTDNKEEAGRVRGEHPSTEFETVIRDDRLLGQLAPLRAFGDFRYKWTEKELRRVIRALNTPHATNLLPPAYRTPPYLSVLPQVARHKLEPSDRFLILATDGLWDELDPQTVVTLVGEHLQAKDVEGGLEIPSGPDAPPLTLGRLSAMLTRRQAAAPKTSMDGNGATHVLRHALGPEHRKVSHMLTLPQDIAREYRDDITVTIVYFNHDDGVGW